MASTPRPFSAPTHTDSIHEYGANQQLQLNRMADDLVSTQFALLNSQRQTNEVAKKLAATETLLNDRVMSDQKHRRALAEAKRAKRDAEAKLAACEDELRALKADHEDLKVKAKWFVTKA